MSNARQHFEQFKDHTLLKHAILRAYLERWARILLSAKAGNHDVVFIDCFAGTRMAFRHSDVQRAPVTVTPIVLGTVCVGLT